MADFNAAAVDALFAAVVSVVKKAGRFRDVITHEPKAKPASLPAVAVWWDKLMPARSSGLSSTSGVIQFCVRVYQASIDRKSTRLNSSHQIISYAVFCLKKKKKGCFVQRKFPSEASSSVKVAKRFVQCFGGGGIVQLVCVGVCCDEF